jgi:tRNA-specific adenosine deaminase 1
VDPEKAYIDTLVLPEDRYLTVGCSRSFGAEGRLKPISQSDWGGNYAFRPFKVQTTDLKFDFSKTSVDQRGGKLSASNLAAAWTASGVEETILGGVVQGRKAFDIKGGSHMSRRSMWSKGKQLEELLGDQHCLSVQVYRDIKELPALAARASVKAEVRGKALAGWIRNEGDEDFRLD